ncbi:hypothetical protein EV368DRAFT_63718 [Lentinula lateritia]|uniref:Uncharacterized protein n=1 Tax=Lentinula aff. lateritia TaxID=2804960 RepID=A0ACC1U7A4_9AGAR|nr:hypothetical protein F5876DRAFT_63667 [Lentinula aff. lateritia]KAJ3853890.1 hypothetical protein EV368DRAFT_63718 [Lentinula lateritia]
MLSLLSKAVSLAILVTAVVASPAGNGVEWGGGGTTYGLFNGCLSHRVNAAQEIKNAASRCRIRVPQVLPLFWGFWVSFSRAPMFLSDSIASPSLGLRRSRVARDQLVGNWLNFY